MQCPFCHATNAATSCACRVCGAPLRAAKPKIAPVFVRPVPTEIARHTFDGNAAELVCASFTPDQSSTVCLVRQNGVVQLWDASSGEISAFSVRRMFREWSWLCCALATENWVATGAANGEARWHNWNARERKSPSPHAGRVLALAANSTHLYSGGNDGVIWTTDFDDKKSRSRALIEGLGAMTTFAVSPDAQLIAVGCDDGAVEVWRATADKSSAQLDWTRREHHFAIDSLSFSPNGQMILSRDRSGALCLWAAQTSYQLPLAPDAQCSHVAPAFSSDNRWLALANAQNGVSIFDVALGTLLYEIAPFDEKITHLSFASGAPWLLVAGAREIAIWNVV